MGDFHVIDSIENTVKLMEDWGMFKNLTKNERKIIINRLTSIARHGLIDVNNGMNDVIRNLDNELKNFNM